MDITLDEVEPFMDPPPADAKAALLASWLLAISGQLTKVFGDTLPTMIAPTVYDIVGVALNRRLTANAYDPRLRAQSTGPSSVQYNMNVATLRGWFWPDEANTLDLLFGSGGSISSVRTPAPDAIRFGNRAGPRLTGEVYGDASGLGINSGFGFGDYSELEYGDNS